MWRVRGWQLSGLSERYLSLVEYRHRCTLSNCKIKHNQLYEVIKTTFQFIKHSRMLQTQAIQDLDGRQGASARVRSNNFDVVLIYSLFQLPTCDHLVSPRAGEQGSSYTNLRDLTRGYRRHQPPLLTEHPIIQLSPSCMITKKIIYINTLYA